MEPENTSNSTGAELALAPRKIKNWTVAFFKAFVPMIFFREDSPLFVLQSFMQDNASP
jgi:hypothetical protein